MLCVLVYADLEIHMGARFMQKEARLAGTVALLSTIRYVVTSLSGQELRSLQLPFESALEQPGV